MELHGGAGADRICETISKAVTCVVFRDLSAYDALTQTDRREIRRNVSQMCTGRLTSDDLPERALEDIVRAAWESVSVDTRLSASELRGLCATVVKLVASDAHGLLPLPLCGMGGVGSTEGVRGVPGTSAAGTGIDDEGQAPIGFELFLPVTRVRRLVAGGGGRGLVHQLATQDAVTRYESEEIPTATFAKDRVDLFGWLVRYVARPDRAGRRDPLGRLTARRMIAGVIWNDLPTADPLDPNYATEKLDEGEAGRIVGEQARRLGLPHTAKVAVEGRFAYNPSDGMLMRLIWILGKSKLKLVSDSDPIYQSHHGIHAIFHSMARTVDEGSPTKRSAVLSAILSTAVVWFTKAVHSQDLFPLGHLLHMVQDAYAEGHVDRARDSKGSVISFRYYGNQSSKFHHDQDSLKAYVTGRFRARCTEVQLTLLRIYVEALRGTVTGHEIRYYVAELTKVLREDIYPFHAGR